MIPPALIGLAFALVFCALGVVIACAICELILRVGDKRQRGPER